MNVSYFRKSSFDKKTTVKNMKAEAEKQGWEVLGEVDLPDSNATVVSMCKSKMLDEMLSIEPQLLSFLPCSLIVYEREGVVRVGATEPAILGSITTNQKIAEIGAKAEASLKKLMHAALGVEELKPEKIILYATTVCPYCKLEEQWLKNNNVVFEKVLVDQNTQAAEEVVRKTGQMGVPITEITYQDAEPEYVVGFDRGKLSNILGIKS